MCLPGLSLYDAVVSMEPNPFGRAEPTARPCPESEPALCMQQCQMHCRGGGGEEYASWRQFNEKPSVVPGCPAVRIADTLLSICYGCK